MVTIMVTTILLFNNKLQLIILYVWLLPLTRVFDLIEKIVKYCHIL